MRALGGDQGTLGCPPKADSSEWNARYVWNAGVVQYKVQCGHADSSEWHARHGGRLTCRNGTLGMSYIMQMIVFQQEVD